MPFLFPALNLQSDRNRSLICRQDLSILCISFLLESLHILLIRVIEAGNCIRSSDDTHSLVVQNRVILLRGGVGASSVSVLAMQQEAIMRGFLPGLTFPLANITVPLTVYTVFFLLVTHGELDVVPHPRHLLLSWPHVVYLPSLAVLL